jgi:hypothetical protein
MKKLGLALTALFLVACDENKEIESWLLNAPQAVSRISQLDSVGRLERKDYEVSRDYARGLVELTLAMQNNSNAKSRFLSEYSKRGAKGVCQDFLLRTSEEKRLYELCTRNGFFLCAEEVKVINFTKAKLLNALGSTRIDQMRRDSACIEKLEIL